MIKYYDTHSHINEPSYFKDTSKIIENLLENKIFTNAIGCCFDSSVNAINLANQYPNNIRACVGIHPNNVKDFVNDKEIFHKLDKLIENNKDKIVAIGEIGIDLFYTNEFINEQIEFCHKQIELAIKHNLPVMFHVRNAFKEIQEIIKKYSDVKKIIHCFSTNWEEASYFINNNCMISIPGIVTFKNAISLHDAVRKIPLDFLVAETDAPFLTPVPFRGKENYPHYVQYVYEAISELKNSDKEITRKKINANAFKFFNLKD